jgi:5-methylcytosine-specific restriction endonuclease McrA
MIESTARRVARYLDSRLGATTPDWVVNRISKETSLLGFHPWADGKRLIAAYDLRCDENALVALLIDWKNRSDWYLVLCSAATHGPLAELWQEEVSPVDHSLLWQYRPTKRDGRNADRVAYFTRHVGDHQLRLSIPSESETSERFIDDLFDLVDNRVRADDLNPDEPEPRREFPEGQTYERLHLARERNRTLIRLAKDNARKRGRLVCQVCGFDFAKQYGGVGEGFIEAHHTIPVSEIIPGTPTRLEDIALVCANCHRMLHRRRPWLKMDQLRSLLDGAG